jgi:hypothetical protein
VRRAHRVAGEKSGWTLFAKIGCAIFFEFLEKENDQTGLSRKDREQ